MTKKTGLQGKVITADALYAQEVLCGKIVDASANYVIKVKKNKKRIMQDIEENFSIYARTNLQLDKYETITKAHGRIDHRAIEVMEVQRKYFGGWGIDTIKQVARITRIVFDIKKQKEKKETHYIISSLLRSECNAKDLLKYSVRHWSIENNLHRTRDTHYKEDICNIICQKSQQINAAMRNLAIYLLSKINLSIAEALFLVGQKIQRAFDLICRKI